MQLAAVLIAPAGVSGTLRELVDRLGSVGVQVTTVDDLATAIEVSRSYRRPPTILLDLREVGDGEIEDQQVAADAIAKTIARLPNALPVVVTTAAEATLIVACLRAGAGDVLDLQLEGTAAARAVVQRICERQAARSAEIAMVGTQRDLIEELLKDLIRTERRAIDAEDSLAARAHTTGELATPIEGRPPAVLVVEHDRSVAGELADRLEDAGVATFAYVTGEEALREVTAQAATIRLDLALVATRPPGIDALETIRQLRLLIPELPALIGVAHNDGALAQRAAQLGVGVLAKPLGDLDAVVVRLTAAARESLHRSREHAYLQRIKERHERVLASYRSLPRVP
jgi:CheY-like chemotaxis protein